MTISAFANQHYAGSWGEYGKPIARAYRDHKRGEAEQRQADYTAEYGTSHPQVGPVLKAGRKLRDGLL